jgi:hypothetical protein
VAPPPAQPPPPAPPPPAYAQPAQPSPPGAPASYPPQFRPRDTWYIGFGLGSGGGQYRDSVGTRALSDIGTDSTSVFLNFKVGATLTPRLLLGLDIAGISTTGSAGTGWFGPMNATVQITNYDAMLTWFPMERGLFLRGGAGLSAFTLDDPSAITLRSIRGVNATVGGGYAFWLGRTFNLTVNLDLSAQRYDSSAAGAPTRSNFTALWLGFDWY